MYPTAILLLSKQRMSFDVDFYFLILLQPLVVRGFAGNVTFPDSCTHLKAVVSSFIAGLW